MSNSPSPRRHDVSRETSTRRRAGALVALLGVAALVAAGCAAAAGPRGWAGAQPVTVEDEELILAAHRSRLHAITENSGIARWQFPPRDRDSFPISQLSRERLLALVAELNLPDEQTVIVAERIESLTVSGPSGDGLSQSLRDAQVNETARDQVNDAANEIRDFERRALTGVRALYGQIALSDNQQVAYVATFGGWLFAVEVRTGQTIWVQDGGAQMVGGVAVEGDTIYVGNADGTLTARDAATGAVQWEFDAQGEVWATPTLTDDAIYITTLDGHVYRLDREGAEQWRFDADAGIGAPVVVEDGALYVGAFDNRLYSIDPDDGAANWTASADNWFWATPVVQDGTVYAASLDGHVYAFAADSGQRRWREDVGAPVRSNPVIAGDGLVVASRDGAIHKLELDSGQPVGSPFQTNSTIESNLTMNADDIVYAVPRDAFVYIITATDALGARSFTLPQ